MILGVQIKSLIFSFFYGVVFFVVGFLMKGLLLHKKLVIGLISSFIFMMFFSTIYFICLWYLNNGIIHEYFLIMFIFGVLGGYFILKKCKR